MTRITRLLLLAGLLCIGQQAAGHARSESYSTWQITGNDVSAELTVAAAEVTTLVDPDNTLPPDTLLVEHIADTVQVYAEGARCAGPDLTPLQAARGFLRVEFRFACENASPDTIHYRALFDRLPAHVHFARIVDADGVLSETLFTDRANRWSRGADALRPDFTVYLDIGVRHILAGLDHIAFLLGMLLIAGTLKRGIAAVTGFTLGHSLSLGAAVLGVVEADSRLIEAFIGFTVALLAVEFFLQRRGTGQGLALSTLLVAWAVGALAVAAGLVSPRAGLAYAGFGVFSYCYLRASGAAADGARYSTLTLLVATACFGLIHGFGFAGFLMDTGIEGGSLIAPLAGFNIGVELGQLAIVLAAFLAFRLFSTPRLAVIAPITAAGLAGTGVFWFVSRTLAA